MSSLMTRLLSSSSTSSKSSRSSKSSKGSTQTAESSVIPPSEETHSRKKSDASTGSFSFKRLSYRDSTRNANTALVRQPSVLASPPPSPTYELKDPLPNDAGSLDGLLNYHLSQLGRIKNEVINYNTTIEQLEYTYCDIMNTTSKITSHMLWARIQAARLARDNLCSFAMFHVEEIDRIVQHKTTMMGSPEIMTNM